MSGFRIALLTQRTEGWSLAVSAAERVTHSTDEQVAWTDVGGNGDLAEALQRLSARFPRLRLVLSVPSPWCMVVPTSELREEVCRRFLEAPGRFLVEQWLPLQAEQFYLGAVITDNRAIAVAIEKVRIDPVLAAAASARLEIAAVVPEPLLAAQARKRQAEQGILYLSHASADVLVYGQERPRAWHSCMLDAHSIEREVQILGLQEADLELVDTRAAHPSDLLSFLHRKLSDGTEFWGEVRVPQVRARSTAVERATALVLHAAAASMLICALGALLVAIKATSASRDIQLRVEDTYRDLFPGREQPLDVGLAVDSELRRLRQVAEVDQLGPSLPADEQLMLCLRALPRQTRLRVNEFRFGPEAFVVDGEALSLGDAEGVAAAVNRTGTLAAEAPRIEQLNADRVAFVLTGRVREAR